ncbi:MAG: hypothetical protein EA376_00235 [Phycisphaeraceae bacterium]|nr:MAG: hypothetical protein EA376_00235 [Phycisphaeraceae bacterium]
MPVELEGRRGACARRASGGEFSTRPGCVQRGDHRAGGRNTERLWFSLKVVSPRARGRLYNRGVESNGGYELEPLPAAPDLPGVVVVRRGVDDLIDAIASDLVIHAHNCVRAFGDFHLALSGGPAAEPLYMRLMTDPSYRNLPWRRTHLWLVEERRVGFEDERSAFRRIRETIVDHSGIPPEQTHPIFPLADDADERYEAELRETLGWREKGHDRLDFALLTVDPAPAPGSAPAPAPGSEPGSEPDIDPGSAGNSGGSALLSPGFEASMVGRNPTNAERDRLVRMHSVDPAMGEAGPELPEGFISLTLPMLNACRFVAVLAAGRSSRDTVARLSGFGRASGGASGGAARGGGREAGDRSDLPITPHEGELRWYLDHEACPA